MAEWIAPWQQVLTGNTSHIVADLEPGTRPEPEGGGLKPSKVPHSWYLRPSSEDHISKFLQPPKKKCHHLGIEYSTHEPIWGTPQSNDIKQCFIFFYFQCWASIPGSLCVLDKFTISQALYFQWVSSKTASSRWVVVCSVHCIAQLCSVILSHQHFTTFSSTYFCKTSELKFPQDISRTAASLPT